MANPTTTIGLPSLIVATTTNAAVVLDPAYGYVLSHTGYDNAGSASTAVVFASTAGAPAATYAEASDKALITTTKPLLVGPGVSTINLKTASGTALIEVTPDLKTRL